MTEKSAAELQEEVARLRAEIEVCRKGLLEAHQMMAVGQLLAGIVHEINTPIGSILTNNETSARSLEMLRQLIERSRAEDKAPSAKATKILEVLLSLAAVDKIACERISAVVRGLKTFVGGKHTEFREASLNEILDNTLKLAHCEFRKRIRVETHYGNLPKVQCDAHQIGQVFLNLLVNAGQAIEGEGTVTVTTRPEDGMVHVSISDNGGGIAPEHRSKVFSPGFTTKPSGIGTGLGLAISRDIIVNGHGGSITFETEVGRGTTFHIRLPALRTDPRQEAKSD